MTPEKKSNHEEISPNKPKKYFLSFVEEMIGNPAYEDYVAGRLEVDDGGIYAKEEIRFFTKDKKKFIEFRDRWDFKVVNEKTLGNIRDLMKKRFYDKVE